MKDKASKNSLQLVIFNFFEKNVAKICHLAIFIKKSPNQHGQKNNTLEK
jgi:hypothetical protein